MKKESIAYLRKLLPPGSTILTMLNHVSKSGMTRSISLYIARRSEILDITAHAAVAMERSIDVRHRGIRIGGCGMDMGFALVYDLGRTLNPKGFKHNKNTHPRNGSTSPRDSDGGYTYNQRWI